MGVVRLAVEPQFDTRSSNLSLNEIAKMARTVLFLRIHGVVRDETLFGSRLFNHALESSLGRVASQSVVAYHERGMDTANLR